ncbi:MAG: IS607 family transposase [Kosmotogaceae bacterium]|nr:IS607 family transposase [Kosmotogaceae bacterium]
MDKLVSVSKAANLLGVHIATLREWDREGKLHPVRTKGNHRRYKISDIDLILGEPKKNDPSQIRVATYCRVSSTEQKKKGDLERQVGRVLSYCIQKKYQVVSSFDEVGSGMSDNRSKLRQLFKLVEGRKIDRVVIEHKDRLCRFMFDFLVSYFNSYGVEIKWIDDVLGKSYEQELVEDMLSLMSSFSAKIYGKRSAENRKKNKLIALRGKATNEKLVKIMLENPE